MVTINKIAKTGIISGLLMGAVALKATNPITNVKQTPNQNQTEIVSKAGADALRAANMQGVQQNSVPTVHNQRLDNLFRKFATNEEEKKMVNSVINATYSTKGTFLAAAFIQHELDRQQICLLTEEKGDLLTKNGINPELGEKIKKFGSDFYKSVRPNAKKVEEWLDKHYSPNLLNLLSFDNKPSGEEVIKKLDDIAENKVSFELDDIIDYHVATDDFKRKNIQNKTDNLSMSELIAFKMFTIDQILIKKTLTNCNFFGKDSQFAKYANLEGYYDDWMNSVSPARK